METLYPSVGTLSYSHRGYRLVVEVDRGIVDFYRSLIPKWMPVFKSRYSAHVTVVREDKEEPVHKEYWGKHQGEKITLFYSSEIHQGEVYYWLNVFCVRLEDIRLELGLSARSEYTIPPEGFRKCFHMTIANKKINK